MAGAVRQQVPILSVASFRAWLASRSEEEHWELIEGAPMLTTPPNRRHQRIASNLEALLNGALRRHNPLLTAYHDIGVNIVSTVPYDPEPAVAVIREDENPDPRYAERFYLVAEVLSESDKGVIESKRDIYRAHPSCTCILLVRQDLMEIIVERRTGEGWRAQVLHAADELSLPEFGLTCPVADVYRDTALGRGD
jgi:Uma2 family endonuclease